MAFRTSQRDKLEVECEGPADVIQKLSGTNYIVSVPVKRKLQQVYDSNHYTGQREVDVQMLTNAPGEISADIPELGSVADGGNTAKVVSDLVMSAELEPKQKKEFQELLEEFKDRFWTNQAVPPS